MPTEPSTARGRVESIDVLRGVIMILMALDHTRDFFGHPGARPTDPAQASAALFFTRWITHFCAPVFFLLTGTGAYLALQRRSKAEMSRFLLTRGLWLLFLDLVVMRCLALQWNFDFRVSALLVLWALGWSMIALAGLLRFAPRTVGIFGVAMIALHNLTDAVRPQALGVLGPIWAILHQPGVLLQTPLATPRVTLLVAYPLIPWIGVTAAGFALGQVFAWPAERRRLFLLRLGAALTLGFVALRALNVYGDPFPWSPQSTPWRTALSFLNANKYPPSLLFLMMTLGPALMLLAALERRTPRMLAPALVIGRVPLFYYLVHFPLIHGIAFAVCLAQNGTAHWLFESPTLDRYPFTPPPGWGFDLPVVYLVWIAVVVALYPACRWFGAVKARSSAVWLSYL